MSALDFFCAALMRLRKPKGAPLRPIRLALESSELECLATLDDFLQWQGPGDGALYQLTGPVHLEEGPLMARLVGRVGGGPLPEWADGAGGAPRFGVHICRVREALFAPEFGAVVTRSGAVLKSSVGEALFVTSDLSGLPNVTLGENGLELRIPSRVPRLETGSVFMAWGGRFNYGHFLLDCLPALCTADVGNYLESFRPLAPPLLDWHRSLIKLLLEDRAGLVVEVDASWVSVDQLVFASPMDHFLHAPADPLNRVRSQILRNLAEPGVVGPGRVYLSRSHDEKRPMINERLLEEALVMRDFAIVRLMDLAVEDQINILRSAKVVVGPTGAGFANCLFSPLGAKIFEIQPVNYPGIWVRGLCHYLDLDWFGYFAPATMSDTDNNPGVQFRWEAPLDDFLAFLDERL
jgi:capsular polysaccharide biosynthesis protein